MKIPAYLKSRRAQYDVAAAAVGLFVVYGLIDGNESTAWLLLVSAVLGRARTKVPDGE